MTDYNARSEAAKAGAVTRKRNAAKKAALAAMEALGTRDAADVAWEVLMGQVAKSRAIGLEAARTSTGEFKAEYFNLAPSVARVVAALEGLGDELGLAPVVARVVAALADQMKRSRSDIDYVAQQAKKG